MSKQTSTEWLFKKLWDEPKDKLTWYAILEKAEEMHQQDIIDFTFNYFLHNQNGEDIEQYYKETFNK